tara:strand:+ start:2213 stop:2653 length:441 start_codon:yes stop_codon:yes gene_type:complete
MAEIHINGIAPNRGIIKPRFDSKEIEMAGVTSFVAELDGVFTTVAINQCMGIVYGTIAAGDSGTFLGHASYPTNLITEYIDITFVHQTTAMVVDMYTESGGTGFPLVGLPFRYRYQFPIETSYLKFTNTHGSGAASVYVTMKFKEL